MSLAGSLAEQVQQVTKSAKHVAYELVHSLALAAYLHGTPHAEFA